MSKKNHLAVGVAVIAFAVAVLGVGAFFGIKYIVDENHKKDIEMAADCARSFEVPHTEIQWNSSRGGFVDNGAYETLSNNRRTKREECANKYHVTHQEIIDKIGSDNYMAAN